MPSSRKRFTGQFKELLSFLFILQILSVKEVSASAHLSQTRGTNHGQSGAGRYRQPQAPVSLSPFPRTNHDLPDGALASKREPPKINSYIPNRSIQSKKQSGLLNRNAFNPPGRVDSFPGLGINSPRNPYNNGPPIPSSRSTLKESSNQPKTARSARTPRIQKPTVSDGYLDAGDPGRSFNPRGRPDKIDGLRNPTNLLSPSIEGTKIDNIGAPRSLAPPQQAYQPRNPYADKPPQFRSGREYNNAQRNAQFNNPSLNKLQGNGPFSNPRREPDLNSAPHNPPFNNGPTPQRYNDNKRRPNSINGVPRGPSFNSAPAPGDTIDYSQRYNDPQRRSQPQHSNSSVDNPVDLVPYGRPASQSPASKPPGSIPALPEPFQFSNDRFAFPSPNSFGARSPAPRSRPARTYGPSTDLFQGFSSPLGTNAPSIPPIAPTSNVPPQRTPTFQAGPGFRDNRAVANNPVYQGPRRNPVDVNRGVAPAYGSNTGVYNNNNNIINNNNINNNIRARGQCFQYSFPAEAYRLSDLAKDYPSEQIQKEIDAHPYLAPLVGVEAKAVTNDPFTFNAPMSSHFDFSGFGFKNDATTSDKYAHLKNVKAFPGNLDDGELSGRYLSSMQPLDSACPSNEYSLKSFFHQGGDCFVVNPDFQQITYHRCTRQDCNFCGVNRGLSACVEEYRWVTVMAYCSALQENKRIGPMKLLLPVGCSCQHFVC